MQSGLRITNLIGEEEDKLAASSVGSSADAVSGLSSPLILLTQKLGPTHLSGKQQSEKPGV